MTASVLSPARRVLLADSGWPLRPGSKPGFCRLLPSSSWIWLSLAAFSQARLPCVSGAFSSVH